MIKTRIPRKQRLILDNVSWKRYTQLLHIFSDRHLRLTYDRGRLEIMTLSFEHEGVNQFLGRMVIVLTEEFVLDVEEGGSTTFRQIRRKKGLEPDNCYWIANASKIRGKKKIDLRVDPPPDLSLEIDITNSSMNRMRIYAALGVPEVWLYDENGLAFFRLSADGNYEPVVTSPTFSNVISPADLMSFLKMFGTTNTNEIIRQFREWIRAHIAGSSAP